MNPKISIVIPYYNRSNSLTRALESVRAQTYKNIEIVLVNDGSTDDSGDVVDSFALNNKHLKIINISQENKGPAAARNIAIKNSSGEFIAFLDSDDSWVPEKLSTQMDLADKYSADLVSCNSNVITSIGLSRKYYTRRSFEKINYKKALFKYYTSTPCVLVRKSAIIDVGGFPEDMRIGEDMVVFYRIIRRFNACVSGQFLTNIHKDLYGYGGLTGDMKNGYFAIVRSLKIAREDDRFCEKKIGAILYYLALLFATLNYCRRLLVVRVNEIRRKLIKN